MEQKANQRVSRRKNADCEGEEKGLLFFTVLSTSTFFSCYQVNPSDKLLKFISPPKSHPPAPKQLLKCIFSHSVLFIFLIIDTSVIYIASIFSAVFMLQLT